MNWFDFSTAPKDGHEFLAYSRISKKYDVVFYNELYGGGFESTQFDQSVGQLSGEFRVEEATDWCDLEGPIELA